eukprot:TRINITY_DN731_c0_g1_i11.p1 TRINITY_DN731_c0_g1~~TRINITY_DN731_c0_g1_i11.p1  ORF type:complete len:201 (+),score=56.68 TRINITY_DN731_c0_g1_i11:75-677(+)
MAPKSKAATPKVEEVDVDAGSESESSTDGDMPTLEGGAKHDERSKQNRAEKKSRKAVQKLGLKPVPGIVRVTVKKSKNILFVIAKPDVHKAPSSDTYIVFGEAKIEDLSAQAQANAAQQLAGGSAAAAAAGPSGGARDSSGPSVEEVADGEAGDVDESGIEPKDIELVMSQVSCSRAKAVSALRENNNDIVEAIMHLSSS